MLCQLWWGVRLRGPGSSGWGELAGEGGSCGGRCASLSRWDSGVLVD